MPGLEARLRAARQREVARGKLAEKALADRDERVKREERERIIEWLRSDEAGRIAAGARNDPWYIASRLAGALEENRDKGLTDAPRSSRVVPTASG